MEINNPNYSPFKTSKVMSKTFKMILHVINLIIDFFLGHGKDEKEKQ